MKPQHYIIYHLSTSIMIEYQLFNILINIMLITCKVNNFYCYNLLISQHFTVDKALIY